MVAEVLTKTLPLVSVMVMGTLYGTAGGDPASYHAKLPNLGVGNGLLAHEAVRNAEFLGSHPALPAPVTIVQFVTLVAGLPEGIWSNSAPALINIVSPGRVKEMKLVTVVLTLTRVPKLNCPIVFSVTLQLLGITNPGNMVELVQAPLPAAQKFPDAKLFPFTN